jgi:hypothetical protein
MLNVMIEDCVTPGLPIISPLYPATIKKPPPSRTRRGAVATPVIKLRGAPRLDWRS